jgi:hypothetical protein
MPSAPPVAALTCRWSRQPCGYPYHGDTDAERVDTGAPGRWKQATPHRHAKHNIDDAAVTQSSPGARARQ